ncbi:ATP-dependent 6-phosphofructokinase [Candidatus Saccharibacteria bacterium]|nr:ATP-dependent 6-phosphofructokinase [Candidatus Saccharibacteria bacterium]
MKKIAVMTAGGDCPGLNSVIRAVVLSAAAKSMEVVGVLDGFIGFCEGKYMKLDKKTVEDIESLGGTMLGSSNKEAPFRYPSKTSPGEYEDKVEWGVKNLKKNGVEALMVIGGDGSLDSARMIDEAGMPTVGVPKTIDNDMVASDPTIGFSTAVENVVEAIGKLKTTAYSHRRVMVVEIMGRTSGYLTLHGGFSAGADVILLPEIEYDLSAVAEKVKAIMKGGKRYVVVAVSEAAKEVGGEEVVSRIVADSFESKRYGGVGAKLAHELEVLTGHEARATVLGHTQRGGAPNAFDIMLGAKLGSYAFDLVVSGESGVIVGVEAGRLTKMKYPKTREARLLDVGKDDLMRTARDMGVFFGVS